MFLAWREIRHAKLRFALITGVIVLVSSLVFILSGLANGLSAGNTAAIDAMSIDGMVISSDSDYLLDRSSIPAGAADTIAGVNGIDAAEPLGVSSANIKARGGDHVIGVSFFGIVSDSMIEPGATRGEGLSGQDHGVVIDETLTEDGIGLGDTFVTEPGGVELTVVGVTTNRSYRLSPTVYMPLDLWQQLQPRQEGAAPDAVSAIIVRGDHAAVEAIPDAVPNSMIGSTSQIANHIPGESEQNSTLLLIQVFLVVIAAGIIAAFFYIITLQKMPELGVMKAIGTGTGYLARTLIAQVLALAVVGVLLGISVADTLALIIGTAIPYSISTQRMALFGGILLLVAVGGTGLALSGFGRVDPLDAINMAG
jgi:putative ABC transport system permease protein